MHKQMNFPDREAKLSSAAGVSVVELLIVMMIVAGLSTLAVMSFQRSSRSFRLSGATRSLTAYLEKTRVDAVRRHVTDNGARVDINSATSYTVTMDFSGIGTSTSRTINLPTGTTLAYRLPPATTSINPSLTPIAIQYNWRGQTASTVLLTLTDAIAGVAPSTIAVGPAGNLSTNSTVTGPVNTPTPQNTTETTATGIKSMQY
jgi:Tfp pilus assembly protein FimT